MSAHFLVLQSTLAVFSVQDHVLSIEILIKIRYYVI